MGASPQTVVEASAPRPRPNAPRPAGETPIYGWAFWCTYIGNSALMIAYSMLYRYADFVLFLGGNEWTVGRIVGIGMVGSLAMRFFQGYGIDRLGARRIWLCSGVGFIAATLGHMLIDNANGPAIYLLRILYTTSFAGAAGASITSVSRSLPLPRMAEVIGTLGTSGFIGMAVGPQLGDFFCGGETITRGDLHAMFALAAALGALALVCTELATRGEQPPRRRRRPNIWWLVARYHPGFVLVLGLLLGVGFTLPTTFLPTFVKELGISRTGPFFIVYSVTAFIARLSTRRMPHVVGVRPMVYLGLAALVLSLLTYLPVRSEWGLLVPAVFAGISHAVLFPAVTAQGSWAFPNRYRGLGTTVMLAMLDLGILVGAPLVGGIVEFSKSTSLPPYPTTFVVLALGTMVTGVAYAFTGNRGQRGT
ncbi:MAG: MFS transporter [Pirellulales bacterium]